MVRGSRGHRGKWNANRKGAAHMNSYRTDDIKYYEARAAILYRRKLYVARYVISLLRSPVDLFIARKRQNIGDR